MTATKKRQLELEEELRNIDRVLKPKPPEPEEPPTTKERKSVPPPWAPPLLLDD